MNLTVLLPIAGCKPVLNLIAVFVEQGGLTFLEHHIFGSQVEFAAYQKIAQRVVFGRRPELKKLFRDANFVTLLRAENLSTLPQFLAGRITVVGG